MADYSTYKPDWAPKDAGSEFASQVMTGISQTPGTSGKITPTPLRPLTAQEYVEGVLACNRTVLARAITLVESNAPKHFALGQEIIQRILPYTGKAVRAGITGVPGAGKSTFIEALGNYLCDNGHKVAVLAVDPSSTISRGSILGDKTRMETLSKRPEAFIRPSPSGGTLGGVTRKSRETLLLCEAAGFDTILVETVGVGQSETAVRAMVDFFLVLVITGAGDDLQGIKKGVIETADAILVNKADGDNITRAKAVRGEYEQVLHYLRPAPDGWITHAYTASALTGEGVPQIWSVVEQFIGTMRESGVLQERRRQQTLSWVRQLTEEHVRNAVFGDAHIQSCLRAVESDLLGGRVSATQAAQAMIDCIDAFLKPPNDGE
jgi:LAO/AO transport system kinase